MVEAFTKQVCPYCSGYHRTPPEADWFDDPYFMGCWYDMREPPEFQPTPGANPLTSNYDLRSFEGGG